MLCDFISIMITQFRKKYNHRKNCLFLKKLLNFNFYDKISLTDFVNYGIFLLKYMDKGEIDMKKATGVIRKVDELGRIVIPKELRRLFGIIDNQDSFEIFVEGDCIILKKYQPSCIFCNNLEDIHIYEGRNICRECIKRIQEIK